MVRWHDRIVGVPCTVSPVVVWSLQHVWGPIQVLLFSSAIEVAIVSLKIGVVAAVIMVVQEVSVVIGINVITKEIASRAVA